MDREMDVADYLETPETTRRVELIYGYVREPPAPAYGHQDAVTRLTVLLHTHVETAGLGRVCVSPVDVVLDADQNLILQPDIIFVSAARTGIIRDRVWGAPDLVVEVLSPSSRRYDRVTKIAWYEQYGVRECWIADPDRSSVEVVTCVPPPLTRRMFQRDEVVQSGVLTGWHLPAAQHFG
jgi:Uma2 family endonuclease